MRLTTANVPKARLVKKVERVVQYLCDTYAIRVRYVYFDLYLYRVRYYRRTYSMVLLKVVSVRAQVLPPLVERAAAPRLHLQVADLRRLLGGWK